MFWILVKIVLVGLLVAIDQLIKGWAVANLQPVEAMPLLPGVVELRFVLNDGMAFSMLSGQQTFLILFTSAALVVVAWLLFTGKMFGRVGNIGWLLVLAGGIGNLIDRVMNQVVVDYINLLFMDFAVFNFADICVCTGVGLVILDVLLESVQEKKKNDGTV